MSDFDIDDIMKKPIDKGACPAYAYQEASVSVPVEVIPYAKAGYVKTFCKGDPIITSGYDECPGGIDHKCRFTITQKICVKVPVEFGANTVVGSPHIKCDKATGYDICTHCDLPAIELSEEITH